jgi:HUS1 checkpoint protein
MIMSTSSLVRVLKSGTQSLSNAANSEESQMLVKLTKKNDQPCLTFEIILQNSFARGKANGTPAMTIMHDVRVMVIKPTEAALLQEPLCPEPDVCAFPCCFPF